MLTESSNRPHFIHVVRILCLGNLGAGVRNVFGKCATLAAGLTPMTVQPAFSSWRGSTRNGGDGVGHQKMGPSPSAAPAGPSGTSDSTLAGAACPCGQLFTENPLRYSPTWEQPCCNPWSKMLLQDKRSAVLGRQRREHCLEVGIAPSGHSG